MKKDAVIFFLKKLAILKRNLPLNAGTIGTASSGQESIKISTYENADSFGRRVWTPLRMPLKKFPTKTQLLSKDAEQPVPWWRGDHTTPWASRKNWQCSPHDYYFTGLQNEKVEGSEKLKQGSRNLRKPDNLWQGQISFRKTLWDHHMTLWRWSLSYSGEPKMLEMPGPWDFH